ncbi:unnamed protein product [Paramecium sonneborni]|uniref:Transmembrane protein n=1 Tax=Paramecium sonneborni TaxID=65129 RepID=A0A8S1QER6_9CILI|nr:unnamed protein product [Paramecium sonneborni]
MQIIFYKHSSTLYVFISLYQFYSFSYRNHYPYTLINIYIQKNNSAIKHLIKPFSFQLPQSEQFNPLLLDNLYWNYIQANLQFNISLYSLEILINVDHFLKTLSNPILHQMISQIWNLDYLKQSQKYPNLLWISILKLTRKRKSRTFKNKTRVYRKLKEIQKQHLNQQTPRNKELYQFKIQAKQIKKTCLQMSSQQQILSIQKQNHSNILIINMLKNEKMLYNQFRIFRLYALTIIIQINVIIIINDKHITKLFEIITI